ncbi:unnamed protein product (macronuclear) [Paramecium tetraurelia]|uniref:Ras-related protein Rab-1 n=1 Tax=Paramecium tetraurelia TaxID=5888 RepID=Q3SD64_PARTE|nr:uncharacterized protein GSPATT00011076001 [Paramecium tetraurelia]CAI44501.1 rab_C34 [Paramecium tetraurelia]CAK75444.1 unnamed protein product [Paramecium tetraurelia]|eukprot:XP_001442841.1 hypothetical protein (macronuclear) [Paramecium tetraurelia strain d4-2]
MSLGYYDWLVKVIVLGDSGVGKTNILTQFCDQKFSQNYTATIGVDFKIKILNVQDKKIKLQIWDTAGQERFRNITQTYYKGAFGIIFVYSLIDRNSFNNVEGWIKSILESTTDEVCSILVGNKLDSQDRRVQTAEGEKLAQKYNMPFIETSALENKNIQDIFDRLGQNLKIRLENEGQKVSNNTHTQSGQFKLNQEANQTEQPTSSCNSC